MLIAQTPILTGETPVQQLLKLANCPHLAAACAYQFWPGHYSRVAENRDYLNRSGSWSDTGVTLSRGSIKNRLNLSANSLLADAAGALGPNGQIEAAATKLVPNIADWTVQANLAATAATDLFGGSTALKVTEDAEGAKLRYIATTATCAAGTTLAVRFRVKRGVGTRNFIFVCAPGGANKVQATVDLDAGTENLTASGDATVVSSSITARGTWYECEFVFIGSASVADAPIFFFIKEYGAYDGDGTSSLIFSDISVEAASYCSSLIVGAASTTRAADALRFGSLSGLTSGAMLAMLRLPYTGAIPAADVTHLALNGSDSLDNAVRIYTESDDNKLYAELRSGGVSQGTVDLGTYTANTQYAIALDWDATGLRAAINGVEKTATGAVTVPASIDRLEVGRGISTDTAHGGETPLIMCFSALSAAERAALTGATMKAAAFGGI
jgi:hypothetical protein